MLGGGPNVGIQACSRSAEHVVELAGIYLDTLGQRHLDPTARFEISTNADDGDTDHTALGIEAQMMALGRLVEVQRRGGVTDMEVQHVGSRS